MGLSTSSVLIKGQSINATSRINIDVFQICGKLSIKQKTFLLSKRSSWENKNKNDRSYNMNSIGQNGNFKLWKLLIISQYQLALSYILCSTYWHGNLWFSECNHPSKHKLNYNAILQLSTDLNIKSKIIKVSLKEDIGELFNNLGVGKIFLVQTENLKSMKGKINLAL